MLTVKDISIQLSSRAEEFSRMIFPAGERVGSELAVGSISGEKGQSLRVHLVGEKAGVWADFATGESGDLIDLLAKFKNISLSEAIQEAKTWLGIKSPEFEPRQKNYRRPDKPKCHRPKQDDPVHKYLKEDRKLNDNAIEAYKIASGSTKIIFPYLRSGELVFVKHMALQRVGGKKKITVEPGCEPCLFGWQAIPDNSREVTISEGEIDAMTLWQYGFPAMSVPFGGGGKNKQSWIENEFDNMERFEKIFLCLDQDEEGKLATLEISERLGRHRCLVVALPKKDANECLKSGVTREEIQKCFADAKTIDPVGLRGAETYVDDVISHFYPPEGTVLGFNPPWPTVQGKLIFRPSELSIWSGYNGHGKTTVLNQVMLQAISCGEKVCIASLEITPKKTLAKLSQQSSRQHLPTVPIIRKAHDWFCGRLWVFDWVGSINQKILLEVFRYARHRYGITQFVIDSLMKCGMGEDDYNAQKKFVEMWSDFKNETGSHVHLVAHTRKGENEDKVPGKYDVKGTGTITDLADNTFSFWRNKPKEEQRERQSAGQKFNDELLKAPDAILRLDKQRCGDWEGKIPLWWNANAYQYLDGEYVEPRVYIQEIKNPSSYQEVGEGDL